MRNFLECLFILLLIVLFIFLLILIPMAMWEVYTFLINPEHVIIDGDISNDTYDYSNNDSLMHMSNQQILGIP